MKKAVFTNNLFFIFLIGLIIILLGYNIFVSVMGRNIYGIIPIFLDLVLLVLIITKNQYTRLAIIIWASVFLIIGCGFEFVAGLMDLFNNDLGTLKTWPIIQSAIGLGLGIFIISYTRRTVVVSSQPG